MLNFIWTFFFLISFLSALGQTIFAGNTEIWTTLVTALFDSAKSAFTISLNLTGMLCLWLGLLKIAEKSGITDVLAHFLRPLFRKIMPDVPDGHPAFGAIVMNMSANMLGLDNAATPMGLKAMESLQELNPQQDRASAPQILFMVINASAVTLIPINILLYRVELGALNPSAVFIPILLATSVSTLVGFLSVAFVQKLPVFDRVVLSYLGGFGLLIVGVAYLFAQADPQARIVLSTAVGNGILCFLIALFLVTALIKKIQPYDVFIEGAKEGFSVAVRIIPYLVAMLTAIALLRASGVTDLFVLGIEKLLAFCHINTDFVPALPTALMKPLSGSGARAMMIETMQTYGADSFPSFVSSVIQGSTETTFYVLAVYFGAVGIRRTGSALQCALLADFAGIVSAILLSYIFY